VECVDAAAVERVVVIVAATVALAVGCCDDDDEAWRAGPPASGAAIRCCCCCCCCCCGRFWCEPRARICSSSPAAATTESDGTGAATAVRRRELLATMANERAVAAPSADRGRAAPVAATPGSGVSHAVAGRAEFALAAAAGAAAAVAATPLLATPEAAVGVPPLPLSPLPLCTARSSDAVDADDGRRGGRPMAMPTAGRGGGGWATSSTAVASSGSELAAVFGAAPYGVRPWPSASSLPADDGSVADTVVGAEGAIGGGAGASDGAAATVTEESGTRRRTGTLK
jgi:hypothetical protein